MLVGVPGDRITVIRNACRNPSAWENRARRVVPGRGVKLGIADDAQVVLTVGRHEFQKGQEHLLRVFEVLQRSHLLAAARRRTERPRHAGARGDPRRSACRDQIRFLGVRDDVPELLAAADVFWFPSRTKGSVARSSRRWRLGCRRW